MKGFICKILEFTGAYDMLPASGAVVACVSGGADSMCMLEVLRDIAGTRGFTVAAAHFNHKLRGEESDRDEAFVRKYCDEHGIPFHSGSGGVAAYAGLRGMGIEEAARELRYGFFLEAAEAAGAAVIATAHTADDNAETMLFNLARGAGTAGLSGIPPERPACDIVRAYGGGFVGGWAYGGGFVGGRTGGRGFAAGRAEQARIIRPLLCVTRGEVMEFLSARGIPFAEDSTNELDIYTRNRIRHHVMPVLKDVNPRFTEAAAITASLSRTDDEYLCGLADDFIGKHCRPRLSGGDGENACGMDAAREPGATHESGDVRGIGFSADAAELLELPAAISGRVIRQLCGGGLSYKHVKAVLALCAASDPSASLSVPGMTIYREYQRVVFAGMHGGFPEGFEPICPDDWDGYSAAIPGTGLQISCKTVICEAKYTINKSFTSYLFKNIDLCGKMSVRPRREGDALRVHGRNCTKTLQKLFIEHHIPARSRAFVPVVADERGVLAVYGMGRSGRAVPEPGDKALLIDFKDHATSK